ncbi:hypothetical protein APA_3011 [Pseudanabaena sp. lw0831]|nr:hypothetical protein APA_3011 [Pseudanabaena sp. lw0831]
MLEVDKKLCVYTYVAIINPENKGGAKRRLYFLGFYKGLNPLC